MPNGVFGNEPIIDLVLLTVVIRFNGFNSDNTILSDDRIQVWSLDDGE